MKETNSRSDVLHRYRWTVALPVAHSVVAPALFRWGIAQRLVYLKRIDAIDVWDWMPSSIKVLAWLDYPVSAWFSPWWSFHSKPLTTLVAFLLLTSLFWAMIGYLIDRRRTTQRNVPKWPKIILVVIIVTAIPPFLGTFVYQPSLPPMLLWSLVAWRLCRNSRPGSFPQPA